MDMNLNGMHTSGSDVRPHPVNGSRPGSGPAAHAPGRPRTAADTVIQPKLLANNGMLVIDDLGRQRLEPQQLLNRWIVPLEERHDHLMLRNGQHFRVPFDVVLVFSTNRNPLELADQAFLRRIGYKIRFEPLEEADYLTIWQQECRHHGIDYDPALARFVLDELHARHGVPLLPCHPRDLIDMSVDYGRYMNQETLSADALRRAWETYFVGLDEPGGMAS